MKRMASTSATFTSDPDGSIRAKVWLERHGAELPVEFRHNQDLRAALLVVYGRPLAWYFRERDRLLGRTGTVQEVLNDAAQASERTGNAS